MELSLQFSPTAAACTEGRHAIRDFCHARGLDDLAHNAELLTSELLTNALRHALSLITLRAVHEEGSLLIHVSDDGEDIAELTSTRAAPAIHHGRGLFVVNALAGDWGVIGRAVGKTTWFRLP
jgi:anti-sigma regulatory factor (Ser/Thr protein kinase)